MTLEADQTSTYMCQREGFVRILAQRERELCGFLSKEEVCEAESDYGHVYSQILRFSETKPTVPVFSTFEDQNKNSWSESQVWSLVM